MSVYELEIGWAKTANDRRSLHWELLACDGVRGVFPSGRDDLLVVLFDGERHHFHEWMRSLTAGSAA